jgi:hypothetical protein
VEELSTSMEFAQSANPKSLTAKGQEQMSKKIETNKTAPIDAVLAKLARKNMLPCRRGGLPLWYENDQNSTVLDPNDENRFLRGDS